MIEVVSLSSKGQLVIPKDVREEMGLSPKDKFALVASGDNILLKRIKEPDLRKRMRTLMTEFAVEMKKQGITREEAMKEIKLARK